MRTPFGELRFGRMPSHWGMGMLVNNGDCLDCDYGANADRVMFATKLWGHFIAFMWDWVATGPTTQIIGPQQGQGVFYNADTLDDVSQWILALGKQDKPEELKEKLDQGKIVFNYGGYFVYRQQDWAIRPDPLAARRATPISRCRTTSCRATPRRSSPTSGCASTGRSCTSRPKARSSPAPSATSPTSTPTVKGSTAILTGGFVVKADYKLLHDALKIFLEVGYASGDDSEDPNAQRQLPATPTWCRSTTTSAASPSIPTTTSTSILFRRILGTVNNATYFKPGVSYDIVDNFGARVDIMYALANNPVALPGQLAQPRPRDRRARSCTRTKKRASTPASSTACSSRSRALDFPAASTARSSPQTPDTAQTFQARLDVKF